MLFRLSKNRTLLWLLLFAFVQGIGDYFFGEHGETQRLYSIVCVSVSTIFMVRWFVLDAREQNYQFSKPMFLCLAACALGVTPIYFFHTRRKRCSRPILLALLFLLALGLMLMLGEQAAYQIALARYKAGY